MQVNPQTINVFAFIIFDPNLKILLPFKMMGLLWWHQLDHIHNIRKCRIMSMSLTLGHERDILNHAPPTVSVHFRMKHLLYYIQSIRSRKNKPCPLFPSINILFLSEVRHNMEVNTVASFRFTRTLKGLKMFNVTLTLHFRNISA